MTPEDVQTTRENHQLLSLTEHPTWGVFVRLVNEDLQALDSISSIFVEKNREELMREIEVRYHTILKIRSYINDAVLRAESALDEEKEKYDIIKHHTEP